MSVPKVSVSVFVVILAIHVYSFLFHDVYCKSTGSLHYSYMVTNRHFCREIVPSNCSYRRCTSFIGEVWTWVRFFLTWRWPGDLGFFSHQNCILKGSQSNKSFVWLEEKALFGVQYASVCSGLLFECYVSTWPAQASYCSESAQSRCNVACSLKRRYRKHPKHNNRTIRLKLSVGTVC